MMSWVYVFLVSVNPYNELRNTAKFDSLSTAEMQSWPCPMPALQGNFPVEAVTRTMVLSRDAPMLLV